MLLIVGFWSGLKSQENDNYVLVELTDSTKTYIIEGDTFAFINISDIDKSMQKMIKAETDSVVIENLKIEIENRENQILDWKSKYDFQLQRDSLQSEVYYRQVDLYNSLEKDYKKLLNGERLKFALGGGVSLVYSNETKMINDLSISVSPSLVFRRKYLVYTSFGISIQQNINLGIGTFTIF
jgi:hypothetical protein